MARGFGAARREGGSEKQLWSYKRHNNDTLLNKNTRVSDVSI